ncbi:MAG: hypothetical protein LBC88_01655 [Spirochaetaceae bacterium]|nr:hypothetical protein [Spirochaetaceae bacterium]
MGYGADQRGCIFSSCFSFPNISPKSRFTSAAKTGYLLLDVHITGNPSGLAFRITQTGRFLGGVADWYGLKSGSNIIFVKAPEGIYTLNKILDRSPKRVFTDFALEEFPVTVENGMITYAGRLLVDISETVNVHRSRIAVVRYSGLDAYDDAAEYVRTVYRELPGTIPVLNGCPGLPEGRYYTPTIVWGR